MSDSGQIEIKLSKNKLILMIIGSAIFVGIGIWFVINPSTFISRIHYRSTSRIFVGGLVGILFFGLCFIVLIKKLGNNNPVLIVNDEGVVDISSGVGQILWSDISAIEIKTVYRQKILMLIVRNPQEYINRQTNTAKRKLMEMHLRLYGTPISISTNGLQCKFEELKNILNKKFEEFRIKNESLIKPEH